MNLNQHSIKNYQEYTRSYDIRYVSEITHLGLGDFRILKDRDSNTLKRKIDAQFSKWDERWEKNQNILSTRQLKEDKTKLAEEQTNEAQDQIELIDNILINSLDNDNTIDWKKLKDNKRFPERNPYSQLEKELSSIVKPKKEAYKEISKAPVISDIFYLPKFSFLDRLFKTFKEKKLEQIKLRFEFDYNSWLEKKRGIEDYNKSLDYEFELEYSEFEGKNRQVEAHLKLQEQEWLLRKNEYEQVQGDYNLKIDELKEKYFQKDPYAIVEYCDLVLNHSIYPDSFPRDFDLEYNPENNILIVDYVLPSLKHFPKILEVKYIVTKKELKEYYISESQMIKTFDTTMYNIAFRTINELYQADASNAVESIVFNGWINDINKATGKRESSCILSIQIKKSAFVEIDLGNIDPKICFKSFKGIGSSKLYGITAIQPIIHINKNDNRFVSSHEVVGLLDEGSNLAIMPWEDFEHLIREIFEKEFSFNGGEVKVTQASRDGGVDAIAFDPDPIRGGKIVIQAKRYTNTVGVAAVRDLYGTVHNEGANKGILVTTSDYGPDAYEFAKSKPLTLMNGANLLYLLEKHGYKARINIKEAKGIIE